MKKVILYIRVSTISQAEEGYSISEQKERLLAYCKAHGYMVVDIIIDPGHSGSNLNRPGIHLIIEKAQKKEFDKVIVLKLDRLSRSQRNTMYLIEDVFLANGIDFVSMHESFDTSSAFGRAMVGILSVFAQLELETIKERTLAGRTGRAKKGKWHGGGTEPIGYDYIDGNLEVNQEEAKQVRMVYQMYLHGHTVTDISLKMQGYQTKHGDWSNLQTVSTVLDNELYAGVVHFNDVRTPESHTPIINPETAARVHYMRHRNRRDKFQAKESEYLLTGFVFCKRCGARYFARKYPNGNVFYCCHSRAKKNKKMIKDLTCKNDTWSRADLEAIVENQVKEVIEKPQLISEYIKKDRAKNDSANHQKTAYIEEIDSINTQISRLMDLYKDDRVPVGEIAQQIEALHNRKMELSPRSKKDEKGPVKPFFVESLKLMLKGIEWDKLPIERKRHLLRQLVDTVDIDGEIVRIKWAFV